MQPSVGTHSEKYDRPGRGSHMRLKTAGYGLTAGSRGQTMAEYALIIATIAVVSVAFVQNAGTIVSELVGKVSALF
jgi:Flp pilus assembly pilin Flp